MQRSAFWWAATALVTFAGCQVEPGSDSGDLAEDSITKDEARELGGKSDGVDWCERMGWYGDDICDDWCPQPDPDCGSQGKMCGGFAGFTCASDQWCDYDDTLGGGACGIADGSGVCRERPEFCPEVYSPVCGCNGETYSNECDANAAGVDVFASGKCGDDREIASGWCVKNSLDSCETDADCVSGGCGGELCYNPAEGGGISTCECTSPTNVTGCGCVAGKCAWYN